MWAQRPTAGYGTLSMHEAHTVNGVSKCYTEDDVNTEWSRGVGADGVPAASGMCAGGSESFASAHCGGDAPLAVCSQLYSSSDIKWGTDCYQNFACAKELCASIPECGGLQTDVEQTAIWFQGRFDLDSVAVTGHVSHPNANYQCWVGPSVPEGVMCADGADTSYPSPAEAPTCDSVGTAPQPTCEDAGVGGVSGGGGGGGACAALCSDHRGYRQLKPGR